MKFQLFWDSGEITTWSTRTENYNAALQELYQFLGNDIRHVMINRL